MTVIRVDGVKNTIKTLGQIDPQLRREFTANVKTILKPIVTDAKSRYQSTVFPSGTARNWAPGGREIFPLWQKGAANGVGVQTKASRRNSTTIAVVQRGAAASVFEFAKNGSLGAAFNSKNGAPGRVMWPAATQNTEQVTAELETYVNKVSEELNRMLEI